MAEREQKRKPTTARESEEVAYPEIWDHPVARWVRDHQDEARAGYDAAIAE